MCVCVQGHCRDFKVIEHNGHAGMFSVQQETAAVVLNTRINRQSTSFFIFDVVANCSISDIEIPSSVIWTQVLLLLFLYGPPAQSQQALEN